MSGKWTQKLDAISKLPDGYLYITLGKNLVRYSDNGVGGPDPGYPKPLTELFGELPAPFKKGFDTLFEDAKGNVYATKGELCIRYSGGNTNKIDEGYPKSIKDEFGTSGTIFEHRVEACTLSSDGKLYAFSEEKFICFSDGVPSTPDEGYPKLIEGHWGNLPESWGNRFDTMVLWFNGYIYATRNENYVRYDGRGGNTLNSGYPYPIAGHWGGLKDL